MPCFPYPRDTDVEPIRVPLVARTQYSITGPTGFSDIFNRALDAEIQKIQTAECDGWESTSFSLSHLLASAIQSWVFFGIASEALGRNIRHEEFASADSDGPHRFIDLRIPNWYWRELKIRWEGLDDSLTAAEFKAKRAQIEEIYESAQTLVICMDILANRLDDDKLTEILLSLHMLLYLVAYVLESNKLKLTQTTTSLASTKLLKRRMVKNGWCEKRLNFLDASPMLYPAFYFLSSLKPPRINAEDHSSCSSEQCLVTSELSKPLHRTDECLCEDVIVPVDRVNTIVASGGIPLVRITWSPLGKTELKVVPYTPSTRFVAISHVWADQQFGSAQNCLPKCQVGYLDEVLASLPRQGRRLREWVANWWSSRPDEVAPPSRAYKYFWLDSFCIPQAVEYADLRSKAIESMNLIYAAASHTFVFDKGLQALDAGRRPASLVHGGRSTYYSPQDDKLLDVVAYVYASNWMGRAWTLQEGILSGRIVFPLHGSLAYLKLLWPYHDDGVGGFRGFCAYLVTKIPKDYRREARDLFLDRSKPKTKVSKRLQDEPEPFRELVRDHLFTHVEKSLHVDEYRNYARTPVSDLYKFSEKCF